MKDSTKIKILTRYSIGATATTLVSAWFIHEFIKQYEKDKLHKIMSAKVISKFIEVSPATISAKVWQDVEFEWIMAHMKADEAEAKK